MYEQSLVKTIEPIKKTTISRLNKSKKWKYGYNKEHDIVVISKTGEIGEIYEIQNLRIALPKPQSVCKKHNKWIAEDYPKELQKINSKIKIIMLTGYGNLPTAVAAIKQGAIDYLAKPADAEDVENALLADPTKKASPPENPMSADRVKWEHIHRVFELCNRNVSETARRLKMHRRTLQRILSKRSPK